MIRKDRNLFLAHIIEIANKTNTTRRICGRTGAVMALTLALTAAQTAWPAIAAETATGPGMEIGASTGAVQGDGTQVSQGAENTPLIPLVPAYNGDVNSLKTAAETNKLIVAVGDPSDPAKSTVSYYEKDGNGKLMQVFSVDAVSGMKGISSEKVEGDKKTPQGVYSFTMAFGMKDNPGSILPYHKVVNGDHFVDDSNSRYYNRLVNEFEVAKDWNSTENLIRQAPHYNYALVLNYNDTYTPGKGSAIFLHCPKTANNTGTSGCISIPEERMRELMTKADHNTKIIVVPEASYLAYY